MMTSRVNSQPAVAETVRQIRSTLGAFRLDAFGLIEISGPDATSFLQNRLSNDVLALASGQGQLNAVLDRQGKIQGVFSLHRTESDFFLIVEKAALVNAREEIEKYHILEQFQSVDGSGKYELFACQGPESARLLNQHLKPAALKMREYDWSEAFLFGTNARMVKCSLTGEEGFIFVVEKSAAENFWQAFKAAVAEAGGVTANPETFETMRIEAGLPLYEKDYDTETLLPETGLERIAVSYTKGCYLGQETIARIKTYGMVQRALVGLIFNDKASLPENGQTCLLDGKQVGEVRSGCFSPMLDKPVALVYLGKSERVPGRTLNLDIGGKRYEATVSLLPFYDGRDKSGEDLLQEGLKLFSDGYEEAAIRTLKEAIRVQPDLVEAYESLGVMLSRHDQFDEAIALMNKVLELDPDHVLAHTNLSVFWMKKGDKEKAEEEKALATTAAFKKKMQESGLKFDPEAEQRKREQALLEKIAMFREALKFSPEDPLGNFGLGSALLELKRYDEAIEPFEKTIQAQPKHSVAYLSLGKALEGTGSQDAARVTYEKGIEVAAAKGDLMPLKEMQGRLENLQR